MVSEAHAVLGNLVLNKYLHMYFFQVPTQLVVQ